MAFKVRILKPPDKAVDDLIKGVSQSADKWLDGYENPSADPQAHSAESEAAWEDGVERARALHSYKDGIENYDADTAIEVARTVGKANLVSGVKAREKKIRLAFKELFPKIEKSAEEVRAMPSATREDRKARMLKNLDNMIEIGEGKK